MLFAGTVADNLTLGRELPRDEVEDVARRVHADRFVRALAGGYEAPLQERGANLSHGQRQLLSVARALLYNPPVLVLDEATSSVDPETEHLLQDAVDQLVTGRTSIVIAHRFSTIQRADRVVVLQQGHLVEEGPHAILLQRDGLYRTLWELQAGSDGLGRRPGGRRRRAGMTGLGLDAKRVYALVRRVPVGRVVTYGQVAALAGAPRAARAVGQAMRVCPAGVPWHRVVNGRGTISRRGDGSGALSQRLLLEGEGIRFARGRIDLGRFRWPVPRRDPGPVRRFRPGAAPVIPPAPARVRAALQALGVDSDVIELSESARTAAQAAAACGVAVGQIVKSLVFLAGDEPILVLVSGANQADERRLAALSGQTVRRADADAVRGATGYAIGGVPPVGHPRPLRVFIDADLLGYDRLIAAAGTPHAVFPITPGGALPRDRRRRRSISSATPTARPDMTARARGGESARAGDAAGGGLARRAVDGDLRRGRGACACSSTRASPWRRAATASDPAPEEEEALARARLRIEGYAVRATHVAVSHFHADHFRTDAALYAGPAGLGEGPAAR